MLENGIQLSCISHFAEYYVKAIQLNCLTEDIPGHKFPEKLENPHRDKLCIKDCINAQV